MTGRNIFIYNDTRTSLFSKMSGLVDTSKWMVCNFCQKHDLHVHPVTTNFTFSYTGGNCETWMEDIYESLYTTRTFNQETISGKLIICSGISPILTIVIWPGSFLCYFISCCLISDSYFHGIIPSYGNFLHYKSVVERNSDPYMSFSR